MPLRFILVALAAFSLSGCASLPQPELSLESLDGLKLTNVVVTFTDDAHISINDESGQAKVNTDTKASDSSAVGVDSPAKRARVSEAIQFAFQHEVGVKLQAGRPVIARVSIRGFVVPSAQASIVVGIGSAMTASVDLVDVASGKVLQSKPAFTAVGGDGGGLLVGGILGGVKAAIAESNNGAYPATKTERLAYKFCQNYANWLFDRKS